MAVVAASVEFENSSDGGGTTERRRRRRRKRQEFTVAAAAANGFVGAESGELEEKARVAAGGEDRR